jgi:hypothetical protein
VVQSEVFNATTTTASGYEMPFCEAPEGGVEAIVWAESAKASPIVINGNYTIQLSTAIPFYVDAGSVISCFAWVNHNAVFESQSINLSGYYVAPVS